MAQTPELILEDPGVPYGELFYFDNGLYRTGQNQEVTRIDLSDATFPETIIAQGSVDGVFLRTAFDTTANKVFLNDVQNMLFYEAPLDGNSEEFEQFGTFTEGSLGMDTFNDRLYFISNNEQFLSTTFEEPDLNLEVLYEPPNPVFNLTIVDNYLYFATRGDDPTPPVEWRIERLDLLSSNPTPELVAITPQRIWTMSAINGWLYLGSNNSNEVFRISLSQDFPVNTEFVSSITAPNGELFSIAHDGTHLYYNISGDAAGIYRLEDEALNIEKNTKVAITIFPNPATSEITISSKNNLPSKYFIFDKMGREITKGTFSQIKTSIDVSHLSAGVYTLKMNTGFVSRFLKK